MSRATIPHDGLVDLHLHFDGSISVATARRLAQTELSDEELTRLLTVTDGCRDLNEYLARFDVPLSLLQTTEQLTTCVSALRLELAKLGVTYAELRFSPQSHGAKGVTQREAVEAAIAGLAGPGTPARLILCCMRGAGNDAHNRQTVRLAAEFLGRGVVGMDLAGAEALFPTVNYRDLFDLARRLDVPFTIHAGEAAGPQSVRDALSFGARRIGHGVRAVEDPALLRQLAASGVVLELCPTSNLNTGVFSSYEEFPLRTLLDSGVCVTINSDNMAVSNTNVRRELEHMVETFALTQDELNQLLANAKDARFAGD